MRLSSAISECVILGVRVNPRTMEELHAEIASAVATGQRLRIGSQNLHGIYSYHRSEAMRRFQSSAIVRVDGMSLVLVARLLGIPMRRSHRVTWVDWMTPLMRQAEVARWRVYFVGGRASVLSAALTEIRRQHPALSVDGSDGYFDDRAEETLLSKIESTAPHLLIVGMGMPRQEEWILRNLHRLSVPVILTSGAAVEYVAGTAPSAPRWMGRVGLEWLHRLMTNPRRFWRRYLVEPWALSGLFVTQLRHRLRRRDD